jgi:hypothetical protein
MRRIKRCGPVAALSVVIFLALGRAGGQDLVVGINVVNPMRDSMANQNALLDQLKAAGVHIIRCGISNDDKGIDFAKRAAAHGIRIHLIVGPEYMPGAPSRPYQPDVYPAMWGGHPLSYADPALSKAAFQKLFDSLDANNIQLAGVELGNEINWQHSIQNFHSPAKAKSSASRTWTMIPRAGTSPRAFFNTSRFSLYLKKSATTPA